MKHDKLYSCHVSASTPVYVTQLRLTLREGLLVIPRVHSDEWEASFVGLMRDAHGLWGNGFLTRLHQIEGPGGELLVVLIDLDDVPELHQRRWMTWFPDARVSGPRECGGINLAGGQ